MLNPTVIAYGPACTRSVCTTRTGSYSSAETETETEAGTVDRADAEAAGKAATQVLARASAAPVLIRCAMPIAITLPAA